MTANGSKDTLYIPAMVLVWVAHRCKFKGFNTLELCLQFQRDSIKTVYWSITRPTATHACGTSVLKDTIKNKLTVFERNVLRRIFGPAKERDGTWRIKTNDELDKLIRRKNIINHIKAQRLSWFGHLH
jgi:hypothetical protein